MKKPWLTVVVFGLTLALSVLPLTAAPAGANAAIHVGLITTGPTTDADPFSWLAYQGLLRAQTDLSVVGTVYNSADPSAYGPNLQQCVTDGNHLCIATGFPALEATLQAAQNNPGTYFAVVDVPLETNLNNLRGMAFAEIEAGYLAGTLAALMSQSDIVGVVAGMEIAPVIAFVEGYAHGASCVNPYIDVLVNYTGTFTDPDLGADVAQEMMDQGADVIFAAAGPTGNGALLVTTQAARWAIGVDEDQWLSLFQSGAVDGSEKLLSSAMKKIDNAVFDTISDVVDGAFTSGTVLYDLAADGVGLAPFHEADPFVPAGVRNALALVKAGIIDGSIDVAQDCSAAEFVPEPGTVILLGSGLAGLAGYGALRLRPRNRR